MTFGEIIHSFARSESVPAEAVRAALEAPEAFVEKAIPLLEKVAATKSSEEEDAAFCVLVHVLGEIGDSRVFTPLMRVLGLPTEELDILLGDSITETLGQVLISLAGSQAPALEKALGDTDIDQFVRSAIFEAWTRLVLTGKIPRDSARAFLTDYPLRVGLDVDDFGWSSWVDAVTALGFAEMTDFAREHLSSEATIMSMLDGPDVTFEDFERQLSDTLADPDHWKRDPRYEPFAGTIDELSRWHGYSEEYRRERASVLAMDDEAIVDDEDGTSFEELYIASNPYRDVGRNDPCPCGSGKKFKKCCLN